MAPCPSSNTYWVCSTHQQSLSLRQVPEPKHQDGEGESAFGITLRLGHDPMRTPGILIRGRFDLDLDFKLVTERKSARVEHLVAVLKAPTVSR
jgi:hypothetical protein